MIDNGLPDRYDLVRRRLIRSIQVIYQPTMTLRAVQVECSTKRSPGGSAANMLAILLGRLRREPGNGLSFILPR